MAFDFKKEYKEFYMPKNKPAIVRVPAANYIAVRGQGDPNEEGGAYQQAISVLYSVAYTLKMSYKGDHRIEGFYEYVVPPLEGFWWQEGVQGVDYAHKDQFHWISVIRLPDFVKREDFDWAVKEASRKKKLECSAAEFLTIDEGLCVQMMHLGPYDEEPASVAWMDAYLTENGYENDLTDQRLHHEIYLSDARKVPPEKWKTVIRHPIKPAWKVWYERGFWAREEVGEPGREVPLNKTFSWGNQTWKALSAYVCEKGLVLDLAIEAEVEAEKAFIAKWLPYEGQPHRMTQEQQEEAERENPLRADFHAKLLCNGRELREKHGCGTGWMPGECAWEGYCNEDEGRYFLDHYGLDPSLPWSFRRLSFPWAGEREEVKDLRLCLSQRAASFTVGRFRGAKPGLEVPFTHPETGREYTLTVLETEEQELPEHHAQEKGYEYPRRCLAMSYTVTPDLPAIQVRDCGEGDRPRKQTPDGPVEVFSSAVGVLVRQGKEGEARSAVSALYFDLPREVEWRIVLHEKTAEDVEINLLP